ncbi:MAG: acetate--CoA ligase [Burkholderiaceae bacterium]
MSHIEKLAQESRIFHPSEAFSEKAAIPDMAAYEALCAQANKDDLGFWAGLAREHLHWHTPFTQVLNNANPPFYKWFTDGRLNVSYNCLDRRVEQGDGQRTAIIFEADDGAVTRITYQALLDKVCRFANLLKTLGVTAGDRVILYLPMSIEGVAAMQACARLGAIHSVVFGGFSAKSLHERIVDLQACVVITADEQMRGGKCLPLKSVVDDALARGGCDSVRHVLVYRRTGAQVNWVPHRDRDLCALAEQCSTACAPVWVDAEHPLFVLYTSGSTGKPKGIVHASAGYLLWAMQTMRWTFDSKSTDVFWCTADIGWITGHTYVAYGPLAVGITQVVFEGVPTYPTAGRVWSMILQHAVSVLYTAPTAIRALIKACESNENVHPRHYDLSSLRLLGSVGEPINPAAWLWYHREVGGGRCPIVDTFWQTETGGHVITPLPGATPLVPGSCTLPLPGIQAGVVDETGAAVPHGQGGLLVIKRPWPSMLRTIWGDDARFRSTYFPDELGGRFYLAGDGAVRDPETGYFTIMGRIDDVLNVSGHRLGTMEIESALVAHALVAEAAVVGRPDEVTGEAIVAFVVLKQDRPTGADAADMTLALMNWVAQQIGAIAKPKDIRFGDNLPKTRSGKIMRRLLRDIAQGKAITQDVSTLENPGVVAQLAGLE